MNAPRPTAPNQKQNSVLGLEARFASSLERLLDNHGELGGDRHPKVIAVGCSGGSDSFALMHLLAGWAAPRSVKILVLSVDHGLRDGSRLEADMVANQAHILGLDHQLLVWTGNKPKADVQAKARAKRYDLMDQAAAKAGANLLLVAHTMEDQAETQLLRLRHGSGARGLAGMSFCRLLGLTTLGRPLLLERRQALQDWLRGLGHSWATDPSNADGRFERVRIRQWFMDGRRGLVVKCAESAHEIGLWRRDQDLQAAALLKQACQINPAGFVMLDPLVMGKASLETRRGLLAQVMAAVGGRPYPADRSKIDQLDAKISAGQGATLGRAQFCFDRGRLFVFRESRHLTGIDLKPGDHIVWDGRFAVRFDQEKSGAKIYLGPLSQMGWECLMALGFNPDSATLPHALRLSLPAFYRGNKLLAVPHLGYSLTSSADKDGPLVLPRLEWLGEKSLLSGAFVVA